MGGGRRRRGGWAVACEHRKPRMLRRVGGPGEMPPPLVISVPAVVVAPYMRASMASSILLCIH